MILEEVRQNKHQENLETLVYFGKEGLDELVFKIKNIMTLLEGSSSDVNVTVKIDGSPALVMYSNFPKLGGPGVSWKSLPTTLQTGRKPHIFQNEQDIDDYAATKAESDVLGRSPQTLKDALTFGLQLARSIPKGEMWQGDVLWTTTSKKHFNDEKTGDDWIYFQPNTLMYAAASGSDLGKTIAEKDFGITLHTRYDKTFKQSFNVSIDELSSIPENMFVMKAEEIKFNPGSTTFTAEETAIMKDMVNEIENLCSGLNLAEYQEALDDKILNNFMQFAAATCNSKKISFKEHLHNLEEDFGKNIAKRYKVKKNLEDTLDNLRDQIEYRFDTIEQIVELTLAVLSIKLEFIKKMNDMSQFAAKTDLFGKIESTYQEGFTVSDVDGQVVKLVDNDTFTKLNLLAHGSPNAERLTENVNADGSLTVYTATKTENLDSFFVKRQLKFGLNSGSTYGDGIYTTLDLNNDTNYHADTLKQLYGEHIFEFTTDPSHLFFFLYDEFKKTKLCKELGSTFDTFITDQIKHFQLDLPSETIGQMQPDPSDKTWPSVAKNAMAFYKGIKENYYQNADGTLDTPVNGFIYNGKNDGNVGVFWDPYSLIPKRVTHDGGETWTDIDSSSQEYQDYIASAMHIAQNPTHSEQTRIANSDRVFAGNQTPEKQEVYRLVRNFGGAMGSVSNIVIKDNTVDFKFRSNTPQAHPSLHGIKVAKGELNELHNLGFTINKLDGGLCFGSSQKGAPVYKIDDEEYYDLIPKKITKGIRFSNMTIDEWHVPVKMIGEKVATINDCTVIDTKGLNDYDSVVIDYGKADKPRYCYAANEKVKKALMNKIDKEQQQYLKGNSLDESLINVTNFLREKMTPNDSSHVKDYNKVLNQINHTPEPFTMNSKKTDPIYKKNVKTSLINNEKPSPVFLTRDDFDEFRSKIEKQKNKKSSSIVVTSQGEGGSYSHNDPFIKIENPLNPKDDLVFATSSSDGAGARQTDEGKQISVRVEELLFEYLYYGSILQNDSNDFESKNPEELKHMQYAKSAKFDKSLVKKIWEKLCDVVKTETHIDLHKYPVRVYFTNTNYSNKDLNDYIEISNATSLKYNINSFITSNLMMKADILLSIIIKNSTLYIPISVKDGVGNKGARAAGTLVKLITNDSTYKGTSVFHSTFDFLTFFFPEMTEKKLIAELIKGGKSEKSKFVKMLTAKDRKQRNALSKVLSEYAGDGRLLYGKKVKTVTDEEINNDVIDAYFEWLGHPSKFYTVVKIEYNFKNLLLTLDNGQKVDIGLDRAVNSENVNDLKQLLKSATFKMNTNLKVLYDYKSKISEKSMIMADFFNHKQLN